MDEMTTHEPIADEGTSATATEEHVPAEGTPNGGPAPEGTSNRGPATEETVREALKHVMDPELGVNIVDLGLVYDVEISQDGKIYIEYTLTTMGCPIGPLIEHGKRARRDLGRGRDGPSAAVVTRDDVRRGQGRPRVFLAPGSFRPSAHRTPR